MYVTIWKICIKRTPASAFGAGKKIAETERKKVCWGLWHWVKVVDHCVPQLKQKYVCILLNPKNKNKKSILFSEFVLNFLFSAKSSPFSNSFKISFWVVVGKCRNFDSYQHQQNYL
jgi:hypothetical protein